MANSTLGRSPPNTMTPNHRHGVRSPGARAGWRPTLLAGLACTALVAAVDLSTPARAQGGDTTAGRFGAAAYACTGSVDLRSVDWIRRLDQRNRLPYFVQRARDGSLQSTHGPMPALLGSVGMRSLRPGTRVWNRALMRRARYGAALALTLSAALVYLAALAFASPWRAASTALVAALSFAGVATTGQALWQLTAALPFVTSALACVAWSHRSRVALAVAPALLVTATLIRPTSVGATFGLGLAWIVATVTTPRGRGRALAVAAAFALSALAAAPFVAENLRLWGSLTPGTYRVATSIAGSDALFSLAPGRFLPALAALLVSPGRGVLFFAPVALAALALTALRVREQGARDLLASQEGVRFAVAAGVVGQIVLASAYLFWWGGICLGPRFTAEGVWLAAFVACSGPAHPTRRWPGRLTLAAAVWTVAVGLLGLYRYDPSRWDSAVRVNERASRAVWDPANTPLRSMLTSGSPAMDLVDGRAGPFLYCRGDAMVDLMPDVVHTAVEHTDLGRR